MHKNYVCAHQNVCDIICNRGKPLCCCQHCFLCVAVAAAAAASSDLCAARHEILWKSSTAIVCSGVRCLYTTLYYHTATAAASVSTRA
jgi:hypothetical protein